MRQTTVTAGVSGATSAVVLDQYQNPFSVSYAKTGSGTVEVSLTDEQLQAAKMGDLGAMKSGGALNIFDQAVRKARSFELSSTFEAEARSQMANMLTAVETGKATTEQVQNKLSTMMDGFSRSLAQVDPEASLKFRATSAPRCGATCENGYARRAYRMIDYSSRTCAGRTSSLTRRGQSSWKARRR